MIALKSQLKNIMKTITAVVENEQVKRAKILVSPSLTVQATRKGVVDKRDHSVELLVTVGRPNHSSVYYIGRAKKTGQKFPFMKLQMRGKKRAVKKTKKGKR